MIGKMYEARKHTEAFKGNQHTSNVGGSQNGANQTKGKTSVAIAKELGVGQKTVERAEKFAKGIDALKKVSPEAADKVPTLKGVT